jgi:endonuclease-3
VSAAPPLAKVLAALARQHGAPPKPVPRTPFEWVLWQNVAYLVDDERRARAFRALEREIGLAPDDLLRARPEALRAVTAGMRPEDRALRLGECAERALALGGGDLRSLLALPPKAALAALKSFPGIGVPGAECILMHCGALAVLALESNGLRLCVRLGYAREESSYARTYRAVRASLADQAPRGAAALARAHALLRRHGQAVCKRAEPACDDCSLAELCPSARV